MTRRLESCRNALQRMAKSRIMTDPAAYFQDKRLLLDYQSRRLTHGVTTSFAAQKARMAALAAGLDAMSPLKVLSRGYAIAQKEDGAVLSSVDQVTAGERLMLRLSDGSLRCRVEEEKG